MRLKILTTSCSVGLALLLASSLACGAKGDSMRPYNNNDLELITAYTARELCSCLFVSQRGEAECQAFTKASPAVASYRIDVQAKSVSTSALSIWSARAHYLGPRIGCVLE